MEKAQASAMAELTLRGVILGACGAGAPAWGMDPDSLAIEGVLNLRELLHSGYC